GDMQFLDSTHGWLEVNLSQTHLRNGLLFSTQDGGATWTSFALPFTGSITFTSLSVGWLVESDWATLNNTLVGTHDGGKTWTAQTLPLPQGIAATHIVVGLPRFFDQQNGIVPVNVGESTVMYATHNGGTSWAQTATLANFTGDDQAPPFDAGSGHSAWVVVGHNLFTTHNAGATWAAIQHDAHLSGALAMAMRSDTKGYALTENGTCASFKSNCTIQTAIIRTTDGGHTWLPALVSAG
ncbi:MAG: WD40/YVTN/BNR-like repeat-containing protein, partial [Ktedonobacterales bacterium]